MLHKRNQIYALTKPSFMIKFIYILTFLLILLNINKVKASGTYTVGSGQTYTTLKAAFDDINAGTISGVIVLQIAANCSEAVTASLNASGVGSASYTSINIYPTGATRTISGAIAGALITLEGADNVTINGRLGGAGAANSLIIENTNTGTSAYTILLQTDAVSNIVQYCTIKGAGTSASKGTIAFLTAAAGGNDSNTLDNNTITKSSTNLPYNQIYSAGTAANTNSAISITNNDIVDYSVSGINVNSESTTWTITGNSFYQSASITPIADYYFIYINTGSGYTITGNYLGGQAASCGGNNFTLSTSGFYIYGINFGSSASGGTTNVISTNVITNLNLTNTVASSSESISQIGLICTGGSSDFTIGSSGNANRIGETTGVADATSGITIACNGNPSFYPSLTVFHCVSSGLNSIAYNTIGAITYTTSVNNNFDEVSMVRITTTGTTTVDNNTFGNTTADNISVTSKTSDLYGVRSDNQAKNLTISNNTFQNFTALDVASGTNIGIMGIYTEDGSLPISINNNTFSNFTNKCTTHSADASFSFGSLMGIYMYGSGTSDWEIYSNTFSNFIHEYSGANLITVVGLHVRFTSSSGNVNVYKNKITSLKNASASSSSGLLGIYLDVDGTGTLLAHNNIILLDDNSNTTAKILRGLLDYASKTTTIAYNTVKLHATYSAGTGTSAAFTFNGSGNHTIKNNIWQNVSTGSGTQQGQRWISTQTLSGNVSNNYTECTNTSNISFYSSSNRDLATWQGASYANTATEISGSISVSSTVGNASSSTSVGSAGTPIGGITIDYEGTTRNVTTPWIGAFETATPLPISLISFEGVQEDRSNKLRWTTASEKNNDYFTVEKTTDGKTFEEIGNIQGAGNSIYYNSYQLTDINVEPIINYYRLKQTDFDGKSTYSDIISLDNRIDSQNERKLIKITNTWGQEIDENYRGVVIYIYSDGTIERKFNY